MEPASNSPINPHVPPVHPPQLPANSEAGALVPATPAVSTGAWLSSWVSTIAHPIATYASNQKEKNEKYLIDLTGSEEFTKFVKKLAKHCPNLIDLFGSSAISAIVGSSNKEATHEQLFVYVVSNLGRHLFPEGGPKTQTEIVVAIFQYLTKLVGRILEKSSKNPDVSQARFYEDIAKQEIDEAIKVVINVPGAGLVVIGKIIPYLFAICKSANTLAPHAQTQNPLVKTAENFLLSFVKDTLREFPESKTLNDIDPGLTPIAKSIFPLILQDAQFKPLWAFIEKHMPSLTQEIVNHLFVRFEAKTLEELVVLIGDDFTKLYNASSNDSIALAFTILNRYFAPVIESPLIPQFLKNIFQKTLVDALEKLLNANRATIPVSLVAFEKEKPIFTNDPLKEFKCDNEARTLCIALSEKFGSKIHDKIPTRYQPLVSLDLEKQALEKVLYHIFGRLALKFKPQNFEELKSQIIRFCHSKIPAIIDYGNLRNSPQIEIKQFYPVAEELLQNTLPCLLIVSRAPIHEVATYLFYIYDLIGPKGPFLMQRELDDHIEKWVSLIIKKHAGDGRTAEELLTQYCHEPFIKLPSAVRSFAFYKLRSHLEMALKTAKPGPLSPDGSLTNRSIEREMNSLLDIFKEEFVKPELTDLNNSLVHIFKKLENNPGCLLEIVHQKDYSLLEDFLFETYFAKEIQTVKPSIEKYAAYRIRQAIQKMIENNQRKLERLLIQFNYKPMSVNRADLMESVNSVISSLCKKPGFLADYILNQGPDEMVQAIYKIYFKSKITPEDEKKCLEFIHKAYQLKQDDFKKGEVDPKLGALTEGVRKTFEKNYQIDVDLFLETLIDKILFIALKDPIKVLPELSLNPQDINDPRTLSYVRSALHQQLKLSFENIDYPLLLEWMTHFGQSRAQSFARFRERVTLPVTTTLKKVDADLAIAEFLKKIPEAYRELASQWLTKVKPDEGERGEMARLFLLSPDLEERTRELKYLFINVNHDEVFIGKLVLMHLFPKLEEYEELAETISDLLTPLLAEMTGSIPEEIAIYSEKDLNSLKMDHLGNLEKPAVEVIDFLQKIPQLREPIAEALADEGIFLESNLLFKVFEAIAKHLFKNFSQGNHPDFFIEFLMEVANQQFFQFKTDEEFETFARRLIFQFCPLLRAFPNSLVVKVGQVLKKIQLMVPTHDRQKELKALTELLTDKERAKKEDPLFEKRDRYVAKIETASELFSRFIIGELKALGKKDLPDPLKRAPEIPHPFIEHSQQVLTTLFLKGIVAFLKKVEAKIKLKEGEELKKERLFGLGMIEILNTIKKTFPSYSKNLTENDFLVAADTLWTLFDLDHEIKIDLSEVKSVILPKLLLKYYMQTFRSIESIEHNQKVLQEQFNKNSINVFCNVLGNVWIRDYVPFALETQKGELAEIIRESINTFLKGDVLDKEDGYLFETAMDEIVNMGKERSLPNDNPVLSAYGFIGKFAEGLLLQFFADFFGGVNFDGLHQKIARNFVTQAAKYYPKVVEIKGRESYAHRVGNEKLKQGLGELYNNLLPLGEKVTDAQLELLTKIKLPRPVPFPDLFSDTVEEKANSRLIPQILFSIFKTIASPQTINKGLLSLISMINASLSSNWDRQEDHFEEVNNKLDDLNYTLQNEPKIKQIQKLLLDIKNEYGADWAKIKEILDYVMTEIQREKVSLGEILAEVAKKHNALKTEWQALQNDKDLLNKLSSLKTAIVNLVPSKLIAPLLKIEHFNEMTDLQLGLLYVNMLNDQNVGQWINRGIEVLLTSMVPNGKIIEVGGHIKFVSKDSSELEVKHMDNNYTPAEEARDRKAIIEGLATVTVNGTNKALLHKIKSLIRRFKAFMGSLMIKIFGLWVVKLRDGFNLVYDFLAEKIVGPFIYALGYFPLLVVKYFEHLFIRFELNPHYDGFHAEYNKGFIFNSIDELINMFNTHEKDVQNSHAGV